MLKKLGLCIYGELFFRSSAEGVGGESESFLLRDILKFFHVRLRSGFVMQHCSVSRWQDRGKRGRHAARQFYGAGNVGPLFNFGDQRQLQEMFHEARRRTASA